MTTFLSFLFWFGLGLVVYSFAIYPVLLSVVVAFKQLYADIKYVVKGADRRIATNAFDAPSISVVISAFNEESHILERIENLLGLDYPRDRLQILIGSDGSSDRTDALAGSIVDDRLSFISFEENRGKSSVLNDLVGRAKGELLVFSDANTIFEDDALLKLIRHFKDINVGGVCGELRLVDSSSAENLDGIYWQYERLLKFQESRLNALLGANGAIYAIRKELYQSIPNDTLVDDFTIAMNVRLMGGRLIYDPEAIAVEEVAPSTGDEFKRRVRIGSGNYQVLSRYKQLLKPSHGWLWWAYLSHKVMRWTTPFILLACLAISILLGLTSPLYLLIAFLQLGVYTGSYYCRDMIFSNKLVSLVVFWVNMNIALGLGAVRFYRGQSKGTWDRTER